MTTANDEGTSPLRPEVVGIDPSSDRQGDGPAEDGSTAETEEGAVERTESIEQPAKLLRIGSMVKQLLEEVRQAPLDEAGRGRLREIHEQSIRELSGGLSPDLVAELERVTIPFDSSVPSEAELRIAQAQLVGWLEGLFHGIQATLVAQQMAARAQLDEMRQQQALPPGTDPSTGRPGTYL
jgi:hypothetical protein